VTDGLISRNPCTLVKPPRAPAGRVVPWTGGQVGAVRQYLPARYKALADVGAGLGLRQGEAFGLAVDDVDWMRRVVHVRRQVRIVGTTMTFAPPKGGRERDVPLPESIALRLSAHIAAYPPAAVTLPWKVPDGRPATARLVFTDSGGAALHRSGFNAVAWQPALRGAGMPLARENGMHALRHYFASACLHNGVDIRALAAYLGHSDPGFTLRVYTHLMPDADDRMRQAVDAAFSASDGPATAQGAAR
jgi:integrase